MAFDRQIELVALHALAIIADADQAAAAVTKCDIDLAGACIEGILGQFLDDARRALDHFARSDAVGDPFRKSANLHSPSLVLYQARRQSAASAIRSIKARTLAVSSLAEG